MPGGDRTGPWGFGPGSGRGLGYCSGYDRPGYMQPGFGAGMGRGGFAAPYGGFGRGGGRGRGFRRFAPYHPYPYAGPYTAYPYTPYPYTVYPGTYPDYFPSGVPGQEQKQPGNRSGKQRK
jgi:hypothetical protein